jgi:hypothetical protein
MFQKVITKKKYFPLHLCELNMITNNKKALPSLSDRNLFTTIDISRYLWGMFFVTNIYVLAFTYFKILMTKCINM